MSKNSANIYWLIISVVVILLAYAAIAHQSLAWLSEMVGGTKPTATMRVHYGSDPNQFGDLWLPKSPSVHPVIIMIHGGCWQSSLPGVELMSSIAEDLQKRGIAVWNIEYRRLGSSGAGYPGTFLDIASGIDYLRTLSGQYRLDLSHLLILGHSAGGQLALWAGARAQIKPSSAVYTIRPLAIESVITLGGIDDLKAYRDSDSNACGGSETIDRLVDARGRQNQDIYGDTSPAAMLPLNVKQTIISGRLDRIVPMHFGDDYVSLARSKGDDASALDLEGAGHFELIDPRSPAWARIKESISTLMSHGLLSR